MISSPSSRYVPLLINYYIILNILLKILNGFDKEGQEVESEQEDEEYGADDYDDEEGEAELDAAQIE